MNDNLPRIFQNILFWYCWTVKLKIKFSSVLIRNDLNFSIICRVNNPAIPKYSRIYETSQTSILPTTVQYHRTFIDNLFFIPLFPTAIHTRYQRQTQTCEINTKNSVCTDDRVVDIYRKKSLRMVKKMAGGWYGTMWKNRVAGERFFHVTQTI